MKKDLRVNRPIAFLVGRLKHNLCDDSSFETLFLNILVLRLHVRSNDDQTAVTILHGIADSSEDLILDIMGVFSVLVQRDFCYFQIKSKSLACFCESISQLAHLDSTEVDQPDTELAGRIVQRLGKQIEKGLLAFLDLVVSTEL